jgi:hypothetical protein
VASLLIPGPIKRLIGNRREARNGYCASGWPLSSWMKLKLTRLLMWMGIAAAATYLFDPEQGERRRKDLRKQVDKMRKMGRKARLQAGL